MPAYAQTNETRAGIRGRGGEKGSKKTRWGERERGTGIRGSGVGGRGSGGGFIMRTDSKKSGGWASNGGGAAAAAAAGEEVGTRLRFSTWTKKKGRARGRGRGNLEGFWFN